LVNLIDLGNLSMTCDRLFPWGHYIWFLIKNSFTTCIYSCIIKCIIYVLIAKSSLHCKYLETCANLYNEHATLMFINTTHLYLVYIFTILCFNHSINYFHKIPTNLKVLKPSFVILLSHENLWIPCFWLHVNLIS
jgi:hypothetical protein